MEVYWPDSNRVNLQITVKLDEDVKNWEYNRIARIYAGKPKLRIPESRKAEPGSLAYEPCILSEKGRVYQVLT